MDRKWKQIYFVNKLYKAELILRKLEDNNIEGVLLNKKDHATMVFGTIEIWVDETDEDAAKKVIAETGL